MGPSPIPIKVALGEAPPDALGGSVDVPADGPAERGGVVEVGRGGVDSGIPTKVAFGPRVPLNSASSWATDDLMWGGKVVASIGATPSSVALAIGRTDPRRASALMGGNGVGSLAWPMA